jgi:hypothetical protein
MSMQHRNSFQAHDLADAAVQSAAAESGFKDTRALLFKQPMTTETSSVSTSKSCFRLGLSAA